MRVKPKRRNLIIIIGLFLCLFAGSFYISYLLSEKNTSKNISQEKLAAVSSPEVEKPEEPVKPVPKPALTEITLSSAGDCTIGWDDKFSFDASLGDVFKRNNQDYSYFFKNVANIFAQDDITTVNLETTFTNETAKANKEYTFKAPPSFAKVVTSGHIEGVNIANNHTMDYLQKGFTDTKAALKAEKINYFGEGEKWITDVKGVRFGFLGYRGYSYDKAYLTTLKKDIESLKSQNCIVIINFHWGDEGVNNPNEVQKYLAHYAIDNGADLIIGHHPHVIQGIEKYKGKIICYSLANFCFGGNKNPADKDTFIFQTKFRLEDNKLKSYGVKVIPCSISSVSNINDYCPTPLTDAKKEQFFNRINKLSPNLGFSLKDDYFFIDVNN